MAQIGTLLSGNGTVTTIAGLSQCDEFILIGDVDTANPLQGLTVEINGQTIVNIQNQALITAFSKYLMEVAGSVVGLMIKVATGRIKGNTVLRFVNTGATTPAIFAFSDNDGGLPFITATRVILQNSYEDFSGFDALFVNAPANLQQAVVNFSNGFSANMTVAELAAYFALENQSEADGYLGGVLVIDNRDNRISSIRLFATGANLNVLQLQIPKV